jgi:hypothetical protein
MDALLAGVPLVDVQRDFARNIVSLRESQDLFDDLSHDPAHWTLAQQVEDAVKPPVYRSPLPVIQRPFEDAEWFNAIRWPFENWRASRWSDGSFGVWYGAERIETTVHETAFHWLRGLLADAGFDQGPVVGERRVYAVACRAALLDFRPAVRRRPALVHKSDYAATQAVGTRLHHEGHPGLLAPSVRHEGGLNVAVFNPAVLSNPRFTVALTYRLEGETISVERVPGRCWFVLDARAW